MDSHYQPTHERRVHQRVNATLPVNINAMRGSTIDVSPGGFFLQLDRELDTSSKHYFEIRLATDEPIYLTGMATVARKESRQSYNCYGMRILHSKIQVN